MPKIGNHLDQGGASRRAGGNARRSQRAGGGGSIAVRFDRSEVPECLRKVGCPGLAYSLVRSLCAKVFCKKAWLVLKRPRLGIRERERNGMTLHRAGSCGFNCHTVL